MNSDDNDSRRNRGSRPEDNPFIAFRRFADSQVSSLLNTVFSLPATINNARAARHQCLFGHADRAKCDELLQTEQRTSQLLRESYELARDGDLHSALKRSQEVVKLERQADELRESILEGSSERLDVENQSVPTDTPTYLIEKVANHKGQQWGWSWDWGFPRPFDEGEDTRKERMNDRADRCRRWQSRHETSTPTHTESIVEEWVKPWFDSLKQYEEEIVPKELATYRAIPISPSYLPQNLEEDEQLKHANVQWRDAFEDLMRISRGLPSAPPEQPGQSKRASFDEVPRLPFSFLNHPDRDLWEAEKAPEEPSYEYSHDHEDQHDEPPSPKVKQGKWSCEAQEPETELDAYERLLRKHAPKLEDPVNKADRPSILSTLTTTERTITPDGTITTKVTLKKRFNDGREEISETVQTQRGQGEQNQDQWNASQHEHPAAQEPSKGSERKGGWFWSN